MADYIYLLENRLSAAQQRAIRTVRNLARAQEYTIFLTGGAVRDLTAGSAVRDLDLTVGGDVAALRQPLEDAGAIVTGEHADAHALYLLFPGGVRVEISAAVSVEFPKPGQPVYTPSGIIEDLRRRDFTANAMALSLNEGSYGLLMDPLNGVADIENRELRLISNYGFIEDPSRMVRATRLSSRLGWQMEERTRQRYDNAKSEDLFASAPAFHTRYELEEIFYEEDPVRIMRALDAEGWLKLLSPELAAAKPNEAALDELREKQGQLVTQGISADAASLAFPLIVGKLSAPEIDALKQSFARTGFGQGIDSLENRTRELQARFSGKEAAAPSSAWRMLHAAEPELVLSMLVSGKGAVQSRLKTFLQDSPGARQRLPYATLQEMRITPDLPVYSELLDKLFFELMDGNLSTPEELKAYLEPYSPPAPPPPVNLRRARAKKEARPSRAKGKKAAVVAETVEEQEEALGVAEGLMEPGTLTGPDRGPEPTPDVPLEGKVAPLAPGQPEPEAKAPPRTPKVIVVSPDADSPAARKLSAKPAPVAKADRAAVTPHPEAAREIAAKRTVVIPVQTPSKTTPAPVKAAKAAPAPVRQAPDPVKAAKTVAPPQRSSERESVAKAAPAKSASAKTAPAKTPEPPAGKKPATPPTKAPAAAKPSRTAPVPVKAAKSSAPVKAPAKTVSKAAPSKTSVGKPATKAAAAPAKVPAKKSVAVKSAAKKAVKAAPAKKTARRR